MNLVHRDRTEPIRAQLPTDRFVRVGSHLTSRFPTDGDFHVLPGEAPPKPTGGCTAGNCSKPESGDTPVWQDEDIWDGAHTTDDGHGHVIQIGDLPVPPTFLVELLADDMPEVNICESTAIDPDAPCYAGPEGLRYRITARSGEEGRAVVILQSVYAVPKPAGW